MRSPVCARAFSAFASAEWGDAYLDVEHGAVVQRLRAQLRFSGPEDGHEDVSEAVCYRGRAVCGSLLGKVDGDVAELVLFAAV